MTAVAEQDGGEMHGGKDNQDANAASLNQESSAEIMIPTMDFASELNVYLLLVRAVYNVLTN